MAGGWSRDGAVQEQIDASIEDALTVARRQLTQGESLSHCDECNKQIPEARREALPGVQFCIVCQAEIEKSQSSLSMINRRGSKDSQLR